ncbi:adenylosuccinate lyase [Candidatus Saccharibacteria bacterium]|nr:MAG: adenylosuccinate lyase [Candidatus Saccharibacteria bacterium]
MTLSPLDFSPTSGDNRFNSIDPLDGRYYDPEIARYLSERTRILTQAHVEAALAYGLAEFGLCSQEIAEQIDAASRKISVEAVSEEEKTTRHDVKAIVNTIKKELPETAQPYVHFGATSYDIVSTAMSLQLRRAIRELVLPRLQDLQKTLAQLAERYAETVQIGRTHGQHAVPITFGYFLATYVERLDDSIRHLDILAGELKGKFSGAVGTYNAISVFVDDPLKFEKTVLGFVGLEPAPAATQIVPAEGYIRLLDELAIAAGVMANLSHDMRNLQRSEIGEVREKFEEGQTGSSTMAHKRNPWNFENVIGMWKQVTAQVVNANLNISSEHQRDLTDSSSARFYTTSFALVASMAKRLQEVMSKIEVDEAAMKRNLYLTKGAIAAEPLYLLLEKYGHTTAHEVSKALAHKAMEQNVPLYEVASQAETIAPYWAKFTEKERELILSPEIHYTGLAMMRAHSLAVLNLTNIQHM